MPESASSFSRATTISECNSAGSRARQCTCVAVWLPTSIPRLAHSASSSGSAIGHRESKSRGFGPKALRRADLSFARSADDCVDATSAIRSSTDCIDRDGMPAASHAAETPNLFTQNARRLSRPIDYRRKGHGLSASLGFLANTIEHWVNLCDGFSLCITFNSFVTAINWAYQQSGIIGTQGVKAIPLLLTAGRATFNSDEHTV